MFIILCLIKLIIDVVINSYMTIFVLLSYYFVQLKLVHIDFFSLIFVVVYYTNLRFRTFILGMVTSTVEKRMYFLVM